jgi:hypothetical protein
MDGNGHNPTQKAPSAKVQLLIEFDQMTGAVTVNGPIQNAMFCYGVLEMARQAIQNFAAEAAKGQRILPANVMPMLKSH